MSCGKKHDKGAGGCAFRGARMALQPIADSLHLSHGPVTCQGLPWDVRPTASSGARMHRASLITAMSEMDIIHGGADRLRDTLAEVTACADPAAIFVYQTCAPAIIGDDVGHICKTMSARLGRPVIAVDVPGFSGNRNDGARAAADILLDQVIGRREPDLRTATDINLIGEANVAGECAVVTALLAEAGIRVLASIPGDGRYDAIAGAHRAQAAISLCSQSLGGLAAKMQARYGIPFVEGSFHGMANIAQTLGAVADLLAARGGPADLPERIARLVAERAQRLRRDLAPVLPALAGKRVLLLSGGFKAWGLVTALRELGMTVVGTGVQKTSAVERDRAAALVGAEQVWDETTPARVEACLRSGAVDMVLSGSGVARACQRAGIAWVDINHDRRLALSGYDGQLALARTLAAALRLPVSALSKPAPWRRHAGRP